MVCILLYSYIYSAQLALISLRANSCPVLEIQHYYELILYVTEEAPTALIVPVKVIGVELGNKQL